MEFEEKIMGVFLRIIFCWFVIRLVHFFKWEYSLVFETMFIIMMWWFVRTAKDLGEKVEKEIAY